MKVFVLIHDDRFLESAHVYGVYSTREKAKKDMKTLVNQDYVLNDAVRVCEYEIDTFKPGGHFDEFFEVK